MSPVSWFDLTVCQKAIKLVLKPAGVWCMGLLSIIRAHATISRLENSLRSLMTVPGYFFSEIMVLVSFYGGTFTEGSVKISPIFRGYFMRLEYWDCLVVLLGFFV